MSQDITADLLIQEALAEKAKREQSKRTVKPQTWAEFAPTTTIRSGKGMVPFHPFPHQQLLNQIIDNHYGTVIVKSRQQGATEQIGNRFLFNAKDPSYAGVVFSKNKDDTSDIARRVRAMALSANLGLPSDSLNFLQVANGGSLYFRPGTAAGGRGIPSVHEILFDEAAHADEVETIYEAAISSTEMVGDDARIIICSTPNGKSGWYYTQLMNDNPDDFDIEKTMERIRAHELYSNGLPGFYWFVDKGGWAKVFIHYSCHPIYGQNANYLEEKRAKKKMSYASVQREYNLSFLDSSAQVFKTDLVAQAQLKQRGFNESKPYIPGRIYVAGVDPNQGADDNFCVAIWDVTSNPVVLHAWYYKSNTPVNYSIQIAIQMLRKYKCRDIIVEVNANRLAWEKIQEAFPRKQVIDHNTTQNRKNTNTEKMVFMLEQGDMVLPRVVDPITGICFVFDEFTNFRQLDTGRREAAFGHHDDLVMASSLALSGLDGEMTGLEALLIMNGST